MPLFCHDAGSAETPVHRRTYDTAVGGPSSAWFISRMKRAAAPMKINRRERMADDRGGCAVSANLTGWLKLLIGETVIDAERI